MYVTNTCQPKTHRQLLQVKEANKPSNCKLTNKHVKLTQAANWAAIKAVRQAVGIPVIANGGVGMIASKQYTSYFEF